MIEVVSAANFSLNQLSDLMNDGFIGYFIDISVDSEYLSQKIRAEHIDLFKSLVMLNDSQPIGLSLIAKRGFKSRVAAMCMIPSARNQGFGKVLLDKVIKDAKNRREKEIILEVIDQNEPAIKLYQHFGFAIARKLFGYTKKLIKDNLIKGELEEVDPNIFYKVLLEHSFPNLPWQMDPLTVVSLIRDHKIFTFNGAFALIRHDKGKLMLRAILTEKDKRGLGLASHLLALISNEFSGLELSVPAIFPENFDHFFVKNGFVKRNISQFEMVLPINH